MRNLIKSTSVLLIACITMVLGCSKSNEDSKIIGRWMSDNLEIEFFEDHTFRGQLPSIDNGNWTILKDGRIKITGATIGTVLLDKKDDLLLFLWQSKGKEGEEAFIKVGSLRIQNDIRGKWLQILVGHALDITKNIIEFKPDGTFTMTTIGLPRNNTFNARYEKVGNNKLKIIVPSGPPNSKIEEYQINNNRLRMKEGDNWSHAFIRIE